MSTLRPTLLIMSLASNVPQGQTASNRAKLSRQTTEPNRTNAKLTTEPNLEPRIERNRTKPRTEPALRYTP